MGNTLHMETERALQAASQITQTCDRLDVALHSLSSRVLEIPWEGRDRDRIWLTLRR